MPQIVNAQPELVLEIDWGNFELGMLMNDAYRQVVASAADQRAVSRVEMYFGDHAENWPIAKIIWGQMLLSCPEDFRPSEAATQRWTDLAQQMNMPFTFDQQGFMVVTENDD